MLAFSYKAKANAPATHRHRHLEMELAALLAHPSCVHPPTFATGRKGLVLSAMKALVAPAKFALKCVTDCCNPSVVATVLITTIHVWRMLPVPAFVQWVPVHSLYVTGSPVPQRCRDMRLT